MTSIRKVLLLATAISTVTVGAMAQTTGTANAMTTATADAESTSAASASTGNMKPLELDLPKPVFVGTPKNIKVENLEVPVAGKREPLQVPADATNLALDKEVSASDEEPIIGDVEQVTDGDKEAADGTYVEFGPGVQWVQIDLGQQSEIFGIVIWHNHMQALVYNDVVVKVADDADMITNVQTVFNSDHDNSANLGVGKDKAYIETNEGKVIDAKGVKGRYVRLYSNGNTNNDLNDYTEVEVYGRPVK